MTHATRRQMLQSASCGFGYLALAGLFGKSVSAAEIASAETAVAAASPSLAARTPPLPAKAKRVIFLCMSGGPAHLDTFDYKPQTGKKPHPGSAFKFAQHGQSGRWVSELLPETAKHVDKLCMLNGMVADVSNHAQSFLQLHTGERLQPRPSIGSWITYGLGTENQNLPGFISINPAKPSTFSSAALPTVFQGTPIGVNGEDMSKATIRNIGGTHLPHDVKRMQLDLVQSLNREHRTNRADDVGLEAAIESLELGFRMQSTAPELLDTSTESAKTLERYGVGNLKKVGTCNGDDFGRQCLLARRFAEAGVRFIEVNHSSWDTHKNHRAETRANCEATDKPIAALLQDLDDRGLLDDTLVVWGGEFGRPGLVPDDKKDETGHNHRGFTFWLAGGGVKRGFLYGKTNETGALSVEQTIHFRDLHATILHLVGLDHDKLAIVQGGRMHRLTHTAGGKVVKEILA